MKRTRNYRFLLLVALSHLFADVAAAGGAVLCIGANDHAAIEVGHVASGCQVLSETKTPEPDAGFGPDNCTNCTDSPLHADAELVSKLISAKIDAPPAHVTDAIPMPLLEAGGIERLIQNCLDLTMTIRAHRTTVLLI